MKVPLLDLKPQYLALKRDIDAAIEAVSESQHFILGTAVKKLEVDVAAYCGTQFGIGVSGDDPLTATLVACRPTSSSRASIRINPDALLEASLPT